MLKHLLELIGKILRMAAVIGLIALVLPRLVTYLHARHRIYDAEKVPSAAIAIVFGAGLRRDGQPTQVLRDRIDTAGDLYRAGKVRLLLFSGSHSGSYNEPEAMRQYALSLGIPDDVILMDTSGDRTFDTCYRAIHIFGFPSAILVTQKFHLPRALYTCNQLGMDANGVAADRRSYHRSSLVYWHLREIPATITAMLDIYLLHPISRVSYQPNVNEAESCPIYHKESFNGAH
jgi:SanA protein